MAIGVDHRCDPDFPLGQPPGDLRIVRPLHQLLGQQEGNLHGDPLARMVAAHEEDFGRLSTAALADAEHMDRTALDTATDLLELGNVRPCLGELSQVLIEACRGMIAGDSLGCRESRQMRRYVLQLLDPVAHASQAIDRGFGGAKDQMI
jgi:hypothetical protein